MPARTSCRFFENLAPNAGDWQNLQTATLSRLRLGLGDPRVTQGSPRGRFGQHRLFATKARKMPGGSQKPERDQFAESRA